MPTGNVTAGKSNGFRSIVYMFQSICVPNLNALPHGKLLCRGGEEVCRMRTQQKTETMNRSYSGRGESSRVKLLRLPIDELKTWNTC